MATTDVAFSQTGFPKNTVSALRLMSVKPAGGSMFIVMSSLTVILVADVIAGCLVFAIVSTSVLV